MIKVIIVDDELLLRLGIKSLIEWEENGFVIVGEASNGKEALELIEAFHPDIILTDIKMPIMDGIELIRESSKMGNDTEFIILSCLDDFYYVKEAMKLGAADYLIKSDIKSQHLLEVLMGIKLKIETSKRTRIQNIDIADSVYKSLGFLKENFLKDLMSGLIHQEEEIIGKCKQLHIKLVPENLVVMKIKLDNFVELKKKYVEKDEKLLRFSIVNILEEIIPSKFNREIIVDSSDQYILIVNLHANEESSICHHSIGKLCENVASTLKDFINISVSIGISHVFSGFNKLKSAEREADKAIGRRFYLGKGTISFYDSTRRENSEDNHDHLLVKDIEKKIKNDLEILNKEKCKLTIEELYHDLVQHQRSENAVRQIYIRIIELFGAYLPRQMQSDSVKETTPYEGIIVMETMKEIHEYVLKYMDTSFQIARNEQFIHNQSYVEKAIDIISKYYNEDISLQTVAAQINVNASYLSRIFKQEAGDNFVSYLTKVRMEKAKYYLKSKKLKIYEVAEKVGYQNYTYFSKIFKKVVGVSPEDYK